MFLRKIGVTAILLAAVMGLLNASSQQIPSGDDSNISQDMPVIPPGASHEERVRIYNAHGYYVLPEKKALEFWDESGYDYSYILEQDIFKK